MNRSVHCADRAQQRCIPPVVDQWLDQFGDEEYDGLGGIRVYFSRQSIRRMEKVLGRHFVRQNNKYLRAYRIRLEAALRHRWPLIRCNINLTFEGTTEEIDVLVADPDSGTMMVCELRWMLGAGDPREVHNRKRACRDKVTQLERKVRWLRIHAAEVVRRAFSTLGASSHEHGWSIEGVVVIDNFGGARSANPDFPVMPLGLFELGMLKSDSLAHFGSWSRSLSWLPQEGVHFQTHTEQIPLAGKTLKYPAGSHIVSRREYLDFVSATIK